MPRKGGWSRVGSSGGFRYVDARGNAITDTEKLERIRALVIPPAWNDVWISPNPNAKLQATGVDAAGRRQYLYHANFRAQQEQAKFDRLIRFAERLPELRAAAAEHLDRDLLDRLRVSAIATRLINAGWFRVGSERYAKESRTYGITTLRKSHVHVRGNRRAGERRGRKEADARRDAPRREGARQYARGCTQLIRQSCGDRTVSRGQNDRRFPTATFAHRARPEHRPRPGRTGPLEPASL